MSADRTFHVVEAIVEGDEAGATVRRRWSDDFKERAVAATLEPGVNVSAVARQMGVSPSQLFGWRRQALAKGTVATSLPDGAAVVAAAPRPAVPVVEISMCGAVIRVAADVVESDLRRVLRAVRQS